MTRNLSKLRQAIFFLCFLASVSVITNCSYAQSASSWQLVWSDEFNGPAGSAPNPQNWTLTQGLTPDGAQSYNCLFGQTTNGCDPSNPNVYLDGNGNLAIVARSAAAAPNGVTTGRISSTSGTNNSTILFGTQYGRVEAGMTLPAGTGNQGVWPAFWMLGNNISSINWPSCGEMDIMEYIGAANPTQVYGTLHGQGYGNDGLGVRATNTAGFGGYHVFGMIWSPNQVQFYVDDITNIYGTISTADLMANQSWVNGGLAAWPFNNPFFLILDLNMGGPFPGNVSSATIYPQTLLVDYVRVYQATPPAAPTHVTATASSQSQVALNWTVSTTTDATYNVYRSSISGTQPQSQSQPNPAVIPQSNQTLIANNITGTSFADANLAPGQTYFYTVTSSGGYSGESAAPQASVTLPASGVGANGGALHVSAAGYSGTGAYIQNSLVSGGFTNAFTATVDTSAVTNPAPQDVYHSERWGPQSWTIAHLSPGSSYDLRMHFAESAWTAAGQRQFNVLVNGQQVLTNFDIFATAGAQNRVVTQTINTVADQNGVILLQLAPGAADQPEIRALDVTPSTGGTTYGNTGGSTAYVAIDSGGPVEGAFEADVNGGSFGLPQNPLTAGGGTNTTTQTISTTGVTNPAPAAVYQTERYGAFGYVYTGLLPSSIYTIRLHFAEGVTTHTAASDRLFNVSVNGTQVLTNYDIFATAGLNQAVIQQVTGTSDEHGILSVQLYPGATDLPSLRGIEITQTGTAPPPPVLPGAPTALSATTASASQINLSWTASNTSGVQYQVFRSTTSGFTPSSSNQVATTTTTTYSDTVLAAATTYYYVVEASNASGSSPASNQASATTAGSGGSNTDVVDINAGGTAAGSYLADTDFTGGTASSTTATINISLVANPAPQSVYQTERFGDFTYTIPNLTPGASYTVNLHFAEIYWTAPGKRQFNVLINGATVLTNFDVFATAGGEDIAIVKSFPATASSSGTITIQFTTGAADLPKISGIEITQPTSLHKTDLQIDAGGAAGGTWLADEDFNGGTASSTTAAINTSLVANPAPQAVYQTERFGDFTYTIPNLTPGASYTVNLHFAEIYWSAAGKRQFNVLINGATVLTNFDVFAAAGGEDIAIVKSFSAIATSNGTITIQFTTGAADLPKVSGIEAVG
jgi:beta-glucanase (GH16 family)